MAFSLAARFETETVRSFGNPCTKLYVVSEALSASIQAVRVHIVARNQGVCDDPTRGIHSYLDVSLIRKRLPGTENSINGPALYSLTHYTPLDFIPYLRNQGWDLVSLSPDKESFNPRLLSLPISRSWQSNDIIVTREQNDSMPELQQLLRFAQKGDRIIVWARAQYLGWYIQVKEVQIVELRTEDFLESDSEQSDDSQNPAQDQETAQTIDMEDLQPFYHNLEPTPINPSGFFDARKVEALARDSKEHVKEVLQTISPGDWLLCDHDCDLQDHRHDTTSCSPADMLSDHISSDDTQARRVHNPCTHYTKTPTVDSLIRLLIVCRTDPLKPLEIVLLTCHRDQIPEHIGPYGALSYCWGDLSKTRIIMLNHIYEMPDDRTNQPGLCYRHPFNVTEQLYTVLCRFRHACRPIPLWIDALCIDQTDQNERNCQVSQMGDIYANATMVCVWLNESQEIRDKVYPAITTLRRFLESCYMDQFDPYQFRAEYGKILDHIEIQNGHLKFVEGISRHKRDIELLFALPWFRRIWVLQEVFRAKANVIVLPSSGTGVRFSDVIFALCYNRLGSDYLRSPEIPNRAPFLWRTLCSRMGNPGSRMETHRVTEGGVAVILKPPVKTSEEPGQDGRLHILNLFEQALTFRSTDPRDKLYALMGLAKEFRSESGFPDKIRPDYGASVTVVFTNFTRFCIEQTKTLAVLTVTAMAVNPNLVTGLNPRIPNDYEFPPLTHPTWALWHAVTERWAEVIGAIVPRYNSLGCLGDHLSTVYGNQAKVSPMGRVLALVDMELLSTQKNEEYLTLSGVQLDEVQIVFPICFRDHRQNLAYTDAKGVSEFCTIHMSWERILNEVLAHRLEHPDSIPTPACSHPSLDSDDEFEASLFEEFLLTVICDQVLFTKNNSAQRPSEERYHPSRCKEIMHHFIPHWLASQPSVVKQKCGHRRFEFDAMLPTLEISRLPRAIVGDWLQEIVKLGECSESDIINHKTGGEMMLHHTVGNWFFLSKTGRLGLCPYGTKVGDKLVALWGAKHASVLRASARDNIEGSVDGRGWMFVGEAMVHKWLGGDYLEGLLRSGEQQERIWVMV